MSSPSTSRSRALLALLGRDRGQWIVLGVLVAIASALALTGPLIVREIVDQAAAGGTSADFVRLALGFLAIAVATQLVTVVVSWFATVAAWRTTNDLRMSMTRHVLGLDHEFHRAHTPGELIQRVDGDVTSVSDFLGKVVPKVVGAILLIAGIIGILAVLDWRLALGMVAYVAVAIMVVVRMRHRAVKESSDEMSSLGKLYGGIEERLTAAEDLRSNGASVHAVWRFVEDSAGAMASAVRRENAFLQMWWAVQGSVVSGAVLSLVVSASLVANGVISLGTAFLLFQYVLLIERPLEDVVHQLETVQKANGAMVRVIDLIAVQPTVVDEGDDRPPAGALSVRLDDVTFDYGDDNAVLHHVDLTIGAGRSVGVVGRTGSGKTTFSRLVLRLVDATEGTVSLGGVPVRRIPLAELRRRVALIPQEVELFAGTVRDNVTLFDPEPSDAAVADALGHVGLSALVDAGIHRELGAGGTGLSAGEAQLLALARVWLRQPDLVVLDEATARIDPVTEQRLEKAVDELSRDRTMLIIAHRLSTLRRVDEVVVFDRGHVVEHDDRATLTAQGDSRFRRLLDLSLDSESESQAEADAESDAAAGGVLAGAPVTTEVAS